MLPRRYDNPGLWQLPRTLFGMVTLYFGGRRMVARRMHEAAAPLGLAVQTDLWRRRATASGRVGRLHLEVCYQDTQRPPNANDGHWPDRTGRITAVVTLPEPAPLGITIRSSGLRAQLRQALSAPADRLRLPGLIGVDVEADDPDRATALLSGREIGTQLRRATRHLQSQLQLEGDTLQLVRSGTSGTDPAAVIALVLDLSDALGAASAQAWALLAAEVGLSVHQGGIPHRLLGTVDGVSVQVRQQRDRETGRMRTVVEARIAPPLPGGTRLGRRAEGQPPGISTQNPVLDTLLVMQTSAPEAARQRLSAPEIAGPLLEVLNEHAGARVTPSAVLIVSASGPWVGLPEKLAAAAELAAVLSRSGPRTSG